ncbi:MAG: hypothetical protein JO030_00785 [Candidatus Eremiobacteraeota bacterium]|nr:hypothetical protein [Candidatus Eremiobacteraeota bacterium]
MTSRARSVAAAMALAALVACSPGWPTVALQGPAARTGTTWLRADAANKKLLYIADSGKFIVDVYTFPDLTLAGRISGINRPQGECSDGDGNVWITATQGLQIVEYAHGGTKPIKVLGDPAGYPAGCAVDPTTHDLAVTNLTGFSGPGEVLIYRHGGGAPAAYADPHQYYYFLAAYDARGNLYSSGQTAKANYALSVLRSGAHKMSGLAIKGATLYFPGTVAWVGSTLVLGDQLCGNRKESCFYRGSLSGTTVRITGVTHLKGACAVAQAVVEATELIGGNVAQCGRGGKGSVDIWPYPRGGRPIKSVTGVDMPTGAALSNAR